MKAIRCQCGSVYPDDMKECPSCGRATNENENHVLSESKEFENIQSGTSTWKSVKGGTTYSYSQTNYKREPKNPNLTPCSACNHPISTQAESCPNCGQPTGVHVCPKCRSVNTKVISGASKAASVWMWGVFAANKVVSKYQCRDCGHKF